MISQGINEYYKIGYNTFDSQIIDVSKIEVFFIFNFFKFLSFLKRWYQEK
jgi:hypothetical protein